MASEFDRLAQALAPGIVLERELASGGMGTVYLGREVALDRLVAIKILQPRLATATAAARFEEEARNAAQLHHPNVVQIHYVGRRDGFFYHVMDFIDGETLQARLARGPMTLDEVLSLGRDLLAALTLAHRHRIVHRDVKPANIFLEDGRALLGDFGIARALDREIHREATAGPIGTPGYMAPEQMVGVASPQSDLYSVGVVLYEACTGLRWLRVPTDQVDWSSVPAPLRTALAGALHLEQHRRWAHAERFAAALPSMRRPSRPGRRVAALVIAASAALAYAVFLRPSPDPVDLTVFPFDASALRDTTVGIELAGRGGWYLDRLPRVTRRATTAAVRAWESSLLPPSERLADVTGRLRSRYGIWGVVRPRGARLEVQIRVADVAKRRETELVVLADSGDRAALGDSIGLAVLRHILPDGVGLYRRAPALFTVKADAVPEFFLGEEAFARDAWKTAEDHYLRALRADSSFVLAAWRLGNVRRWLLSPQAFPASFYPLDARQRLALSPVELRLVDAQFAPGEAERFRLYDEAVRLAPDDAYAALLYGDELFHRGPLAGRPLTEAVAMLRRSLAIDPSLAPAWEHLAWALIRLGRRKEAKEALDSLARTAGRPEESLIYLPDLLPTAYAFRFEPGAAAGTPVLRSLPDLALAARGALAFDLPQAELALGRMLTEVSELRSPYRPSALVAQGVGLMALGRPEAALRQLDSAAVLFPSRGEAELQAAEWRVVPAALGLPGVPAERIAEGRRRLAAVAGGPDTRARRAAWALGLDALRHGDTAQGRARREQLRALGAAGGPLDLLLAGLEERARGDYAAALAVTAPALAYDSAGRAGDPFLRSALHLLRGEWLVAAGRPDDADRAWLWYENTDAVGWPSAEAEAVEVDWVMGPHAGARRAALAFARRDHAGGCVLASRTLGFWNQPEPALAPALDSLRLAARNCGP